MNAVRKAGRWVRWYFEVMAAMDRQKAREHEQAR